MNFLNESETLFKSFVNLLNINFGGSISIERIDPDEWSRKGLRSCDFLITIHSGDKLFRCAVEVKRIMYDIYRNIENDAKPLYLNGEEVGRSCNFCANKSKILNKCITTASEQLKNVARNKFPSILLLYVCPQLRGIIEKEDVYKWLHCGELNKGILENTQHINGVAILDIYAGKATLSLLRNPESNIPMGWEYNILFDSVKE